MIGQRTPDIYITNLFHHEIIFWKVTQALGFIGYYKSPAPRNRVVYKIWGWEDYKKVFAPSAPAQKKMHLANDFLGKEALRCALYQLTIFYYFVIFNNMLGRICVCNVILKKQGHPGVSSLNSFTIINFVYGCVHACVAFCGQFLGAGSFFLPWD